MATYYHNLGNQEKLNLIKEILSVYAYFPENLFFDLVNATNEVGGVSFVNIKGYCSDASQHSEIADQLINIGASYQNITAKDAIKYANANVDDFNKLVDAFSLKYINTDGLSEFQFKSEIKLAFHKALAELTALKPDPDETKSGKPKTDNFIHFNKVLAYNTNTHNLSILGMQVSKTVVSQEPTTPKMVKSAPRVIARQLIQKSVGARAITLRRFNIGNITKYISISGDKIYIE